MKNTGLHVVILFVLSALMISCSNDDGGETIIFEDAFVLSATGPSTISVNQQGTFELSYQTKNTCGNFESFTETLTGSTKTVGIRVKYVGECGDNLQTKTVPYNFTVNTPGTYNFKFRNTSTSFLTRTVVVTE